MKHVQLFISGRLVVKNQPLLPKVRWRNRRNIFHWFLFHRVLEIQLSSMQMNGAILISVLKSIFNITSDWATNGGKLHAYLMRSARDRNYFNQIMLIEFTQGSIG